MACASCGGPLGLAGGMDYQSSDGRRTCGACMQRFVDRRAGHTVAHEHAADGAADGEGYARCRVCGRRYRELVERLRSGMGVIELAPAVNDGEAEEK